MFPVFDNEFTHLLVMFLPGIIYFKVKYHYNIIVALFL